MRSVLARPLAVAAVVLALGACGDPARDWEPGGLYSVTGDGDFRVIKILAIDPDAVSIRLYSESFPARPTAVDPASLTLGAVGAAGGFAIGHMPLSPRDLALWFPVHLATEPVSEAELEGYRMWKEAGGGVFSSEASSEAEAAPSPQPTEDRR